MTIIQVITYFRLIISSITAGLELETLSSTSKLADAKTEKESCLSW